MAKAKTDEAEKTDTEPEAADQKIVHFTDPNTGSEMSAPKYLADIMKAQFSTKTSSKK